MSQKTPDRHYRLEVDERRPAGNKDVRDGYCRFIVYFVYGAEGAREILARDKMELVYGNITWYTINICDGHFGWSWTSHETATGLDELRGILQKLARRMNYCRYSDNNDTENRVTRVMEEVARAEQKLQPPVSAV